MLKLFAHQEKTQTVIETKQRVMKPAKASGLSSLFAIFCATMSVGLGSIATTAQAGEVGTSVGLFTVDAAGQADYSMSIEVPPGIQGVQPQISISYSSAQGNGLVGLGGGLSGLSSISRCGYTPVQDGFARPVQLDKDDYFCMNGQRLVQSKGTTYGANGSEYHTQLESFQLVTAHGSVAYPDGGTSPEYFSVLGKGGSKLVFGANAASRTIDEETGVPSSWKISYLEDKHGNRVDYSYQDYTVTTASGIKQMEVLPSSIRYGRNDAMNVAGDLYVDFIYENRPDTFTAFRRGHQIVSTKRLTNVQTRVGSDVVRDYRIGYEQTPVSGTSRIKTLTECAGSGKCLLPITFTWQESDNSWTAAAQKGVSGLPEALLTAEGYPRGEMLDLNNDGWTDLLTSYRKADGTVVESAYLRDVNGWLSNSGYVLPDVLYDYQQLEEGLPTGQLVDINGDVLPDFVVAYTNAAGQETNTIYLNTGSGWQQAGSLPTVLMAVTADGKPQARASLLDMNADALPDVVQSVQTADGQVLLNTWLNSLDAQQNNTWALSSAHQLPVATISYANNLEGTVQAELYDINGDGLTDIVQSYKATNGVETNKVLLGQMGTTPGMSWSESSDWTLPVVMNDFAASNRGINTAQLLDVNGDGLSDVVQAHTFSNGSTTSNTWLNTGLGWLQDNDYRLPTELIRYEAATDDSGDIAASLATVADLNGDGEPDLMEFYIDETGNEVKRAWLHIDGQWVSNSEYFPPLPLTKLVAGKGSQSHAAIIDINNDGRGDQIISREGETEVIYLAGVANTDVSLPTLVTEFRDGFNNVQQLQYTLGLFDDVYTPDSDGVYPNVDISGPMLLIKRVDASDGAGGIAWATTTFEGKKVNLLGRGDLGYRHKVSTDGRTNVSVLSEFSQEWPYVGSIVNFQKRTAEGVLLEENESTFETVDLFDGLTFMINQPTKTSTSYELDGDLIYSKSQTTTLDNLGNTTRAVQDTQDNTGIYRQIVDNDYINDVANWRIGIPVRTVKTAEAPGTASISSEETFTYSGYNLTKKVSQPSHEHALTEEYQYNGFGHVTQTTLKATGETPRVSSSTYTADGRFIATVTNALGHSANSEYHPFFGLETRTEDANGHIKLKFYDDFARLEKETKVRLQSDEINANATDEQGDISNVLIFHLCTPVPGSVTDSNGADITPAPNPNCPNNAVYYVGAVDNEGEAPDTTYLDARSRIVRKQTQGFDSTSVFVDTIYDDFGRKAKESLLYYKGDTPRWVTREFDLLGRVVKVVNPNGTSVTQSYQGNTSVATNVLGQTTTTVVDPRGKPITVTDNLGGSINYTYDAAGNLLTTTDQSNNVITITYDVLGRKISQDDPDLGIWEYQYDAFGKIIWQKDAKGQITTNEYDIAGRVTKRVDVSGETTWEYDTAAHGLGKLARVSNTNGYVREHTYDQYSRPIETSVAVDGEIHVTETGYLNVSADKVDFIRYPSGLMVRKTYNEYGFPLEVRSNGLVEYEQYAAKVQEAEQYQDQAVVYQDQKAAERQVLYDEAKAEETLGNADQRLALRAAETAQSHIGEYNRRVGKLQSASSKYNRLVKEHGDSIKKRNRLVDLMRYHFRLSAIEATALVLGTELDQLDLSDNGITQGDIHFLEKYKAEIEQLDPRIEALGNQIQLRLDNVRFHEGRVQDIANVINGYNQEAESWSRKARAHYRIVNEKSAAIKAIDDEVQRLADAAKAASDKAETLLAQYNENSLVHWEALKADAEGKILEFKQGKHVKTTAKYDLNTGRLITVYAKSDARTEDQNTEARYATSLESVQEWVASLQTLSTQYQAEKESATALQNSVNQQRDISITNAAFYRDSNDEAMALLEDAEKYRLDVEFDNQEVLINLNDDLKVLTDNTLIQAQNIAASHDTSNDYKSSLLNVTFYNAVSDYHNGVEALYRSAAVAQEAYSTQYRTLATQTPAGIDSLNALSLKRTQLANYNATRQVAFEGAINRGFGSTSRDLQNQYTDEDSVNNLSKMVADVYQGRGDVYFSQREILKNLFSASQGMNSVVGQIHSLKGNSQLASRYEEKATIGNDTIESYDRLGYLFLQRADQTNSEIVAKAIQGQNLDSQNQASFGSLSINYQTQSEVYAEMAEPIFWQNFFNQLGDSQVQSSQVFVAQAEYHNKVALDNAEYKEDAQNELDNAVLGFDGLVLDEKYTWDALGNMTERQQLAEHNDPTQVSFAPINLTQTFGYDGLNRIVSADMSGQAAEYYRITGQASKTYQYDSLGNITYKSDVGTYEYGGNGSVEAGPHAVSRIYGTTEQGHKNTTYEYDANGNMTSGDGRTLEYSAFNKPTDIQNAEGRSQFVYGPERQMVKEITTETVNNTSTTKTIYHFGAYEKIIEGVDITHKYHISTTYGATIAVLIDKADDLPRTNYLHRDHLDSIVAITDERGFVKERFYYDPFGQRHVAVGVGSEFLTNQINLNDTDRGFTGHKMLTALKLIHMKGRLFDPIIGRFSSADPYIQFAGNTQSYNRYSYVLNNPLTFVDPSGYSLFNPFKPLKRLFEYKAEVIKDVIDFAQKKHEQYKNFLKKYGRQIVAVVVAIAIFYFTGGAAAAASGNILAAAASGALAGGVSGFIATGSLKGALQGAVFGAVTAGFATYVNSSALTAVQNIKDAAAAAGHALRTGAQAAIRTIGVIKNVALVVGHGVIGGLQAKLTGGSFSKGFVRGAISKLGSLGTGVVDVGSDFGNHVARGLTTGLVSGAVADLAGGDFKEGFFFGALAYSVNAVGQAYAEKMNDTARVRIYDQERDPEDFDLSGVKRGYPNFEASADAYPLGIGGGLRIGHYEGTWEFRVRLGYGYGGGITIDPNYGGGNLTHLSGSGFIANYSIEGAAGAGWGGGHVGGALEYGTPNVLRGIETPRIGSYFDFDTPVISSSQSSKYGGRASYSIGLNFGWYGNF